MATTIVYLGCMFSGKTKRILADMEKALFAEKDALLLKSAKDTRSHMVASHDGDTMMGEHVTTLEHDPPGLHDGIKLIAIDEAQFIPGVADFCKRQNALGRDVRVAGLNSYANKDPTTWPEMRPFLGFARIVSLEATCTLCKAPAYCSRKLEQTVQEEGTMDVGADEKYIATCETCYTLPVSKERLQHRRDVISKLRRLKNSI